MLNLTQEQLVRFYQVGNAAVRKELKEQLGDRFNETIPVKSRVRTFQDAIEELGNDHEAVIAYRDTEWKLSGKSSKDIIAYLKLRIITEALNEGWKPQFTQNEWRWYAWYELVTNEEIEAMDDENKSRVVGRAYNGANADGGLVYSSANNVSSSSGTGSGSRLAFKSEELAKYAAKQFAEIYADFCFIPVSADVNK